MRLLKSLLVPAVALALLPGTFAKDKDKDKDHDKHGTAQNHPPGWDKGKKTGWGDCDVPPGQAKKVGCHPNSNAHNDHDRDHHVASHHVIEHHDRDRAAEHRAAEKTRSGSPGCGTSCC